jgi:hypothetical protein
MNKKEDTITQIIEAIGIILSLVGVAFGFGFLAAFIWAVPVTSMDHEQPCDVVNYKIETLLPVRTACWFFQRVDGSSPETK